MTDEKLNLIPNLKSRLAHGIFKIVGEKVSGFQRLTHGEINWVYKVSTEKRNLLVRIHKFRDWPDPKILTRVHYLLQRHRITTPKVLHLDNTKKYFPRGWEIMEYCEGMNASDAIRRGKVSFEAFHSRLGALLAKVHQIKLSRFGSFNDSRGFANYLEFRFQKLEKNLKKFEPTSLLPRSLKSDIKTKVSFLIGKLSKSFEPVLIHGDPTPDNCVWTKDKEVVLVDWDNARAGFWLEDFSWLTYFGSHLTSKGSLSKRREVLFRSVLKNHGRCGLTSVEVIKIEKAFHILLAADLLGYYRFSQGNIKFYNKTKNRLFDLLK